MRVLFQMPYPGYLRIYGSTVRLLAERGNQVLISYDKRDKRREGSAAEIESLAGVEIVESVPWSEDRVWTPSVRAVRLAVDYIRYLDPRYADSEYLRRRLDKHLPARFEFLSRLPTLPGWGARTLVWSLLRIERAVPSDPAVNAYLRGLAPDCIVVTPLVTRGEGGVRQTETVKSARFLGIPTALAVGSWDHLSSKGMVHFQPDFAFVWNEIQLREAVELHGMRKDQIATTGAQLFDQWFSREPEQSRQAFLEGLGLAPDQPLLVYVSSSPNIAPADRELAWVKRWICAVRDSADAQTRKAGIIVRPHPGNLDHWKEADLSEFGNAVVFPRTRPSIPMTSREDADYFHTLYFCSAVVGINTSAMIEAASVGRPVFTVKDPAFSDGQDGTIHFRYLAAADSGCLHVASTLDEHVAAIASALRQPEQLQARSEAFVELFVRPHGINRAATPILSDAIEKLAGVKRSAWRPDIGDLMLRGLLQSILSLARPRKKPHVAQPRASR